jgi:ribosomal protein S18 acetylase RimI-like enzyme
VENVKIRHANLIDVDALVEFWSRAGENDSRPVDLPEDVERLIERDAEALIVAELDGVLVATIIAGWDGWRANLYRLAVDPDLRGHGLGRRMLSVAENRLRDLGAERFCAMVLNDNARGQSLWTSANYRQQEDWRRWVKPAQVDSGIGWSLGDSNP